MTRFTIQVVGLIVIVSIGAVPAVHAQAIKCSAFLHVGDGSWRSFQKGTIIGSHGPVTIDAGETVKRTDTRDKADVAAILDGLCG